MSESSTDLRAAIVSALPPGVTIEESSLVPEDSGWFARRAHRLRLRLLGQVGPLIGRALRAGERVRFVTMGVRYNLWEAYFQGAFAMYSNRYALVLTDRRLLMLQVHGRKLRPSDIKNELPLGAIRSVKNRRLMQLELGDGRKLRLTGVPGPDRRHLAALLAASLPEEATHQDRSLQHLCPACLEVVPGAAGKLERCPSDACRVPLRSARRAAWLSAFVPGVGDLYLRHFAAGSQEFVGSMVGLGITVAIWQFALQGVDDLEMALLVTLLLLVLPRIIDYPLTLFMARKGNVPLSYETPALPAGTPLPAGIAADPLPVFPGWVKALFVGTGLALAGMLVLVQPIAISTGRVQSAVRAVEAEAWEEAAAQWQQAEALGWIDADDHARMALAYLRAGRYDDAMPLLDAIGDTPVTAELADAILALIDAPSDP